MQLTLLKSKIHGATVTEAVLEYEGSITIDRKLLDAARILPYEKVMIANLANGNRFETYAIPGKAGSGVVGLNGATVYLGSVGDRIIIFTFAIMTEDEAKTFKPAIVRVDARNRPLGRKKK